MFFVLKKLSICQKTFQTVKVWKVLVFFILFLKPFFCFSQNTPLSNERVFLIKNITDTLVIDSLTIIPNSVEILDNQTHTRLDSFLYEIKNNLILKKTSGFKASEIVVKYRVLPFNLNKKIYRLDSLRIKPAAPIAVGNENNAENANPNSNSIFESGLDYNGNYTQGFSVGNTQNVVVNQNFNLNLAGKLGDLDILASMTDNNLPIQADGNTQQLREFDKIFIQISKNKHKLIAGDFDVQRPKSYFMNYFKKLQGITYSNTTDWLVKKTLTTTQPASLTTKAGLAIARGKFARNILPVQEGNQGPYRLQGNDGGTFFIILAGAEKVWFDGKLLTRGDENDYVIDYNRGEILFTSKRLVNKDSRIIVEFEYADQSYLRSTAFLHNEFKINKLQVNFNFYNEQDSKNTSGNQTLDSLDRAVLRDVGSDITKATPLSYRAVDDGFRSDRIQYALIDTVVDGKVYTNILVYSANPNVAKYTATFTPVGDGRGNYVQDVTATNGRVYKWIAPDSTGQLRGSFEPIRKLTPPNRQQLVTVGLDYQGFKNTKISTEFALSNNDVNRFSALGDSANVGLAIFSNLNHFFDFGKKSDWRFITDVKTEVLQKDFKPLNPYRPAEFTRDWNLPLATNTSSTQQNTIGNLNNVQPKAAEFLLFTNFQLSKKDWFTASYEYDNFKRKTLYDGIKHAAHFNLDKNGWSVLGNFNTLKTKGGTENSQFERPNAGISKVFKNNLKIGTYAERERNERREAQTDTLTRASYSYELWKVFMEKSGATEGVNYGLNYTQRIDNQTFNKQFFQLSKIDEVGANGNFNKKENHHLNWNLTYRNLKVNDTALTTLRAQETYLGRIEYVFNYFKNAVSGSTLYELGSGQEQKIEYQYVRVNKGEGQYVWRNRNNDTIPQLDEFEIAPFQDQADYVRVSLFSNQFVRTNNASFSQSLRIDPRSVLITGIIRKISTQSNVLISRRVKNSTSTEGVSPWNPFELKIPDNDLIGLNIQMRNSLFINRNSAVWDIELGQITNKNRALVVTGFEERGRDEQYIRSRLNVLQQFTFQHYMSLSNQSNLSEAFKNRNYDVRFLKIEPSINWQMTTDFRLIFNYKYKKGKNELAGGKGETLKNNDFSVESTWNQATGAQIRAKVNYVTIAYTGARNTPIEFALLEGLQNGRNMLWTLSFDKSISRNIIFSLQYEGRKTGEIRAIHVGRAQVRATL